MVFLASSEVNRSHYKSWLEIILSRGSLEISLGFKFDRDVCLSFETSPGVWMIENIFLDFWKEKFFVYNFTYFFVFFLSWERAINVCPFLPET